VSDKSDGARELDALISRELFRRDIDVPNDILNAKPVREVVLADLKKAIESVQPPMLFIHPTDYANGAASAQKEGFATIEEWLADGTGVAPQVIVSRNVPEGTAYHSKMPPRWTRHLEEQERERLDDL
jgi:hypothetical protein